MNTSRRALGGLYGLLALALFAAPLQADEKIKSRMVDCDKGQDPAQVLSQELGPQHLEMTLVGTCPGLPGAVQCSNCSGCAHVGTATISGGSTALDQGSVMRDNSA